MQKQPWVSFSLAGVNLTDFGLKIPSPFSVLELSNSEIASMTSWTLKCVVGGDSDNKINVAAFEALLYSGAQSAAKYGKASGVPVAFAFGWLGEDGQIKDHISYTGFTLQFKVSTSGQYMIYIISGFASTAMQSSMPVLRIPALSGFVQPSAVVEGLAKAAKVTSYYNLDIDHNDAPTMISHGAMTTSFNSYVRGTFDGRDDYDSFPGLLRLSKSYSGSRDAAGLKYPWRKLSHVMNNRSVTPLSQFLASSITDKAPQCASFSYWVDEPTMTRPGVIHYKSNAGLTTAQLKDTLQYGTSTTNILSVNGSYNGVAYNMVDMNFSTVGFSVDASGNTVINDEEVVNSWSSSLADVFQTVNIINDVNAIASQFSGDFTVQLPGDTKKYTIAQPISLLLMAGNTVSPASGIYSVMSVSHEVGDTFITTLRLKRLTLGSANQVASSQGIYVSGSSNYPRGSYDTTRNIKSPYRVDFGEIYPTFEHMTIV